jgi:hypothetical protein
MKKKMAMLIIYVHRLHLHKKNVLLHHKEDIPSWNKNVHNWMKNLEKRKVPLPIYSLLPILYKIQVMHGSMNGT